MNLPSARYTIRKEKAILRCPVCNGKVDGDFGTSLVSCFCGWIKTREENRPKEKQKQISDFIQA